MTQKIEQSFENLTKMKEFSEKYSDLFTALIEVKKIHHMKMIYFENMSLHKYWKDKYPSFEEDMAKIGIDRLLGFSLTPEKEEEYNLDGEVVKNGLVPSKKEEKVKADVCCKKCGVPFSICCDTSKPWPYAPCAHVFSLSKEDTHTPDTSKGWQGELVKECYEHSLEGITVYGKLNEKKVVSYIESLISKAVQEERARIRAGVAKLESNTYPFCSMSGEVANSKLDSVLKLLDNPTQ